MTLSHPGRRAAAALHSPALLPLQTNAIRTQHIITEPSETLCPKH